MSVFDHPEFDGHEHVAFHHDAKTGLQAIIAIHDTRLGPALGGCRMWAYADSAEALNDVLRLSKGMTYKNALAGLNWGGGKSVILGDAKTVKTPEMMRAMGRFVEAQGGRYLIAEDVGTNPKDMVAIASQTDHVRGVEGVGFDPSPATAFGVFCGIEAAVAHRLGQKDVAGLTIAVQGLGHVGMDLARRLHRADAKLIVCDVNEASLETARSEFGADVVTPEAIYDVAADVYAPCALGATVNEQTVGRLKASIVAGSANNQLATLEVASLLAQRHVLYAPDFVINAGGVIHIFHEGPRYDRDRAFAHVAGIKATLSQIFVDSDRAGITAVEAAVRLAEERLAGRASLAA